MQPTPNGRLHVGHAGGPYLRADAIARALRRAGDDVSIITGADAYENWVLAECLKSGREPAEVCAEYSAGIKADLDSLDVRLEHWIEPLGARHERPYVELHERILAKLRATGAARLERESIPFGDRSGQPLVGPWIAGRCPVCDQPCGGNTCTYCGGHFQPEQVVDPYARLSNEPISWVEQTNWFVEAADPAESVAALRNAGLSEDLLAPAIRYLREDNGRVRLSHPGPWGVGSSLAPAGSVLSNTYFAYSLYCGEVYARSRKLASDNAFRKDSGVTVVGIFGTDNSIAGMVVPCVIAERAGFKPFDYAVVNCMMYFEGRKCSTSKQHGIWVADLLSGATVTSDELRYYLARIALDRAIGNVTIAALADCVNELRKWRLERLMPALGLAWTEPSPELRVALSNALERQDDYLTPPFVDLSRAADEAERWMASGWNDHNYWLAGVALLTAPIMPALAAQLWGLLGFAGEPSRAALESFRTEWDGDRASDRTGRTGEVRLSDAEAVLGPQDALTAADIMTYTRFGT